MTAVDLAFHHLGVACRDLDREARSYAALGYAPDGSHFDDPAQGVHGVFLTGPGPRLELLVELAGSTVLTPWLDKGIAVYHIAFVTPDMERSIVAAARLGAKLVSSPRAAVAFDGRHVAFVMLPNRMLIELIAAER